MAQFLIDCEYFVFYYCTTLFLIDNVSDMSSRYTFFHLTLFIYLFIHLYMFDMLLYYYFLSLLLIDRLAKSRIFLSLFSRDPNLGA